MKSERGKLLSLLAHSLSARLSLAAQLPTETVAFRRRSFTLDSIRSLRRARGTFFAALLVLASAVFSQ